jgi:hypothetical protein
VGSFTQRHFELIASLPSVAARALCPKIQCKNCTKKVTACCQACCHMEFVPGSFGVQHWTFDSKFCRLSFTTSCRPSSGAKFSAMGAGCSGLSLESGATFVVRASHALFLRCFESGGANWPEETNHRVRPIADSSRRFLRKFLLKFWRIGGHFSAITVSGHHLLTCCRSDWW